MRRPVPRSLRLERDPAGFVAIGRSDGVQPPGEVTRWAVAHGLVISVLGAPRIERDGAVVTFDTRKATALLGYLAVTGPPPAPRDPGRAALARRRRDPGPVGAAPHAVGGPQGARRPRARPSRRDEVELVDGDGVTIDVRAFLAGADVGRRRGGGAGRGPVARGPAGGLRPPRQPRLRRLAGAGGRAAAPGDVLGVRSARRRPRRRGRARRGDRRTPSDGWTSTRCTSRPTAR